VFGAVFSNPVRCSFCGSMVEQVEGLASLIEHLALVHSALYYSSFSCPSCPGIQLVNRDTFAGHWASHHMPSLSLIIVVHDSNVGPRLEWGQALSAYFKSLTLFSITPDNAGPPSNATPWGGWIPRGEKTRILVHEIKLAQNAILPASMTYRGELADQASRRPSMAAPHVRCAAAPFRHQHTEAPRPSGSRASSRPASVYQAPVYPGTSQDHSEWTTVVKKSKKGDGTSGQPAAYDPTDPGPRSRAGSTHMEVETRSTHTLYEDLDDFMSAPAGQLPQGLVGGRAGEGLDDPLASTDEEPEDMLRDEFAK